MPLHAYFDRIGYRGPTEASLAALTAIHRAHIDSIPYENLALHLGGENTLDVSDFHEKIVTQGRGGWCYEMNGTLTWALAEIGFAVTRGAGAVARALIGDEAQDNHLIGFVDLDRRYVVDVGLGDGPSEPFPLEERSWSEGPLQFRLERLDRTWWRFHNHALGMAPSFDFTEEARELASFQPMCTRLQTAEWSPFVSYAMVIRRTPSGYRALRDTTWIEVANNQRREREIRSLEEYRAHLDEILGVSLGENVETLWQNASARAETRATEA